MLIASVYLCYQTLVPADITLQISSSEAHIRVLTTAVTKFRDIMERTLLRATGYASDMLQLGKELRLKQPFFMLCSIFETIITVVSNPDSFLSSPGNAYAELL